MLWSLALLPLLCGLALLAGRVQSRLWLGLTSGIVLAATLLLATVAAALGWTASWEWSGALRLTAELTPLSAVVAILVPIIALPVLVFAAAHEHRPGLTRLIALLLVFVGGMELLVIAADLLTLLIGWELVGACSWALISHEWRQPENPRSGLYAFIMTRFGDLGMVLAALAAYAGGGSFAYADLTALEGPYLQLVAFGLLLSAAAKSGQLPFAPWLFRAMAGPTSVSALLHAATMVAAGAYLLARLQPSLSQAAGFAEATIAVGLATALAGGIVALLQNHAKKLLAASTSAHFGLMFVAVGAGYPAVAILHLVAHAGFKALLFLAAGVAGERVGSYALDRLQVGRALPLAAAFSAIGALALAGIPPLDAGWTKEAVIAAAGHRHMALAALCMVAGGLSAAYAIRFHLCAYGTSREPDEGRAPVGAEYAALGGLAAFSLLLSVLWLPSVQRWLGGLLAADLPSPKTSEFVASLLLLGLGLLVGLFLTRRYPALGASQPAASVAAWLGLPAVISAGATRPFERVAYAAATFDDRILDAVPRGVARCGHRFVAYAAANYDDRVLDAVPQGVAGCGHRFSELLADRDRRVVDRGVEWTAALGARLAAFGDRIGERLADGLPEGSAGIVGLSGREARRLQTGLSHHYYALLTIGTAGMVAILVAGS